MQLRGHGMLIEFIKSLNLKFSIVFKVLLIPSVFIALYALYLVIKGQ